MTPVLGDGAGDAMAGDEPAGSGPGTGLFGLARGPVPRWVAYLQVALFVGVGVALLIGGIRRYDAVQPVAGGRTTTGTVVAVSTTQSCGRHGCSTHWVPTIRFTSASGHTVTFNGPESNTETTTGDHVRVSYDPGNPALAKDVSAGVGDAFLLMGVGSLVILAGFVSFIFGFRRLHAMFNLASARDGTGWVGHSGLHSRPGISAGVAVMVAMVVVQRVMH